MRKTLMAVFCCLLLDIAGPSWPRTVEAAPTEHAVTQPTTSNGSESALVKDYWAVRKVALALTVIGFLLAMIKLGVSEFPSERHRAETLAGLMAVLFVLVAGDRMIAQGVADWFRLPSGSLPPFWR